MWAWGYGDKYCPRKFWWGIFLSFFLYLFIKVLGNVKPRVSGIPGSGIPIPIRILGIPGFFIPKYSYPYPYPYPYPHLTYPKMGMKLSPINVSAKGIKA